MFYNINFITELLLVCDRHINKYYRIQEVSISNSKTFKCFLAYIAQVNYFKTKFKFLLRFFVRLLFFTALLKFPVFYDSNMFQQPHNNNCINYRNAHIPLLHVRNVLKCILPPRENSLDANSSETQEI